MVLKRLALILLVLCLCISCGIPTVAKAQGEGGSGSGPSILNPDTAIKTEFRFPIDVVDPTPQTNPAGATAPGYRAPQQLVIYTPAFGATTQTNEFGVEAIVAGGRIRQMNLNDSPIPPYGFVISGHGSSGQWMKRVLKEGAYADLDPVNRQLIVRITPDVYLFQISKALDKAKERGENYHPQYGDTMLAAQRCYEQLQFMARQGVTSELLKTTAECQRQANLAYYRSVPSVPGQFRGIWVRTTERNPEQIRQAVEALKEARIQDIFIETYYQGRTLFPSRVMAEYGLPNQHQQFQGWDPLKVWIEEAHANNMRVHIWFQTFFAGNRTVSPEPYGPILQKYPQWANVQRLTVGVDHPMPSNVETGHFFLDPANPQVREFLSKLVMETLTHYHPDGLNLDYIRYPASHPVKNATFLSTTWGYSNYSRNVFKAMVEEERKAIEARAVEAAKLAAQQAGKPYVPPPIDPKAPVPKSDPVDLTVSDPLWPRWVSWRKEQVSRFVSEISQKAHQINPQLKVSAVVFHQSQPLNQLKLQDWPRWVRSGWVDALTPIGLGPDVDGVYRDSMEFNHIVEGRIPVYVGIFGMYNRTSPVEFLAQIQAAQKANMPGVVLFERSRLDESYKEALLEGAFRE